MGQDRKLDFTEMNRQVNAMPDPRPQRTAFEQIRAHLTYLGYEIERQAPPHDDAPVCYRAKHFAGNKPKISFRELEPGCVLIDALYSTGAVPSREVFEFLNRANHDMFIVKAVCKPGSDDKLDLRFEAAYNGIYSRHLFSNFFDRMEKDIRHFGAIQGYEDLFGDKGRSDAAQ